MPNDVVEIRNVKSWMLEKIMAVVQVVILVGVGVLFADVRMVRDNSIKFGTKQERLIKDVQNVEYNVRTLNNTVQRLVGQTDGETLERR